jgi:stage II sporulation protein D
MSRRSPVLVLVAALVAVGSAAAAPTLTAPVCASGCYAAPAGSGALFLFNGHGWGHGVGMSQYGAYGYAQHGWSYRQILAHYYPGTTLGTSTVPRIRVLLAQGKKALTISSEVPFTVIDGGGTKHALAAGPVSFGPGLSLAVDGQATKQPLTPPLTFVPGAGGPLTLNRPYRGRIEVDVVDGKLRAIDVVGLEQYLYGVVPSEMPSNWSPEALKAQAVAARSYALATRQLAAPFDVYSDTRSQMYLGIQQEQPSTTAAVDATKHQVVLYGGNVATTYFSSTSGGRTESAQDWQGTPLPYLVSVPDPYDAISPYHDWGPVPVPATTIAAKLKVKGATPTDATTTPNSAGRVDLLDLVASSPLGPTNVQLPATKVRAALGLRSTWFSVGVMLLAPPAPSPPIPYGSSVKLTGLIRGVDGVALEERTSLSSWQSSGTVTTASDGTLQLTVQPTITTDYRLATPQAAAGYVRIRVTPNVTITSATTTQIQGTEQPVLAGAPVQVQQQAADGTWSTDATGVVAADGSFTIPVQLAAGTTYRVVVAPGHGYWPGTTTPTVVR